MGVRGFLTKDTYIPIVDLYMFFKETLLQFNTNIGGYGKGKEDINIRILCKLELIYPPTFCFCFRDIVVHLVLHLHDKAHVRGPVFMRWMHPLEKYMKKLKTMSKIRQIGRFYS